eukprot:COSAG01_NODE_68304_length_264_cov_0.945455_1_plen_27_part_10
MSQALPSCARSVLWNWCCILNQKERIL